jgi:hypothetical protein
MKDAINAFTEIASNLNRLAHDPDSAFSDMSALKEQLDELLWRLRNLG